MRICIDARSLRDVPTSLGRYAADLVSHIAKLDRENEYIVVRRPSRHGPIADQANFREIFSPHDISSPRNILAGARVINALDADVYHSLYHFLPIGVRAQSRRHHFTRPDMGESLPPRRWATLAAEDQRVTRERGYPPSPRRSRPHHRRLGKHAPSCARPRRPRRQSNSRPPRRSSRLALEQRGTDPV